MPEAGTTRSRGDDAPVAFSTVGLPRDERVERWESHNEDALIGLRCRTLTADALEATEINVQVDRLHLARVQGSSHVVERDRTLITRRPAESVALFFSLVGRAFFYHDDGVRTLQPGQLLMCDADRPFMRGFSQGLEELVLKVPRALFTDVTGIARLDEPRVATFAAGADAAAHRLARTIGQAARGDDPVPAEEDDLLELLAGLAGRDRRGPAAAHLAAAHAYIDQHLADPRLAADGVAAAVGLSSRHLSRVFAASGEGVPAYVLRRRLEAARRRIEQAESTSTSLAEIARSCGFASPSHFSSAFRSHFGETARDVRRRAVVERSTTARL